MTKTVKRLDQVFQKQDDGQTEVIRLGERFEVRLPEQPSKGPRWYLASEALTHVSLDWENFRARGYSSGAPGTHVFRFEATAHGHQTLYFVHKALRDSEPRERFTLHIHVV